jgi:hypothetical protein
MLTIENLGEVLHGIDRWVEECEDLGDDAFRGLTAAAFKYVVLGTPEWSGNLAASWRLTVGQPSVGYNETVFKEDAARLGGLAINPEPFSKIRPNYDAIRYAFAIAGKELPLVTLYSEVFISNNAPYAEEVAADRKANGKAFLRQVNLPVEMTHAAADKFGAMGELTELRARALAGEKLA